MRRRNKANYHVYRMIGAKKIDRWFVEEGNPRRTHKNAYELVIRPLYGICENTFLDYRNEADEWSELLPQPAYIELALWLPASLVRNMSPHEANRVARILRRVIGSALQRARRPGKTINAESFLHCLMQELAEHFVVERP